MLSGTANYGSVDWRLWTIHPIVQNSRMVSYISLEPFRKTRIASDLQHKPT